MSKSQRKHLKHAPFYDILARSLARTHHRKHKVHVLKNRHSPTHKHTHTHTQLEARATEGVWMRDILLYPQLCGKPFSISHIIANVHWVQTIKHSYFAWAETLTLVLCSYFVLAFRSEPVPEHHPVVVRFDFVSISVPKHNKLCVQSRLASPKTLVENPKNIFREKFKRLKNTHTHKHIHMYVCTIYYRVERARAKGGRGFLCQMFWWRVIGMVIGIHCV